MQDTSADKIFDNKFKLIFVLLFCVAAFVWLLNYMKFGGFVQNDSHDYAQLARNIYEGNGYATSVLRPFSYQFFDTLPQPEVTRLPGYPYSLAFFFNIFKPDDFTIILFNGIFHIALILLVYLLAFRLSNNVFVSLISALTILCMVSFLSEGLQARPNIMCAALYVAFLYFYLENPQRFFVHGIMLGFLYLIKPNILFIFIAFFLITISRDLKNIRNNIVITGKLSIGFFMGILPYLIGNYLKSGNPFFSLYGYSLLLYTKSFPVYGLWSQIIDVNPLKFVISHPSEILYKSYFWLKMLMKEFVEFYNPFVIFLLCLTFFLPAKDQRLKLLKKVTIVGIVIQTAFLVPVVAVAYYYMFFFPIIVIISILNAHKYLKQYSKSGLLCGLVIIAITTIPYWREPKRISPFMAIGKHIEMSTNKEDIILTDIAWEMTWYANRKTIWLPYDIDTLRKINKTLSPQYLLLSQWIVTRSYPHGPFGPYKDNMWSKMINNPSYAKNFGFELQNVIFMNNIPVAFMFRIM